MKKSFDILMKGAPGKATHRMAMTEKISANEKNMFHFFSKTFWQGDRFDDLEEVERLIKSMEASDGWAA